MFRVSTPAWVLQRGLAEFSVGEAHQAAAVTAGPAYSSHLRGAGVQIRARSSGGKEHGERREVRCQPKPKTARQPERRPCWKTRTPQQSSAFCCGNPSRRTEPAQCRRCRRRARHGSTTARLLPGGEWGGGLRDGGRAPTVCGRPNRHEGTNLPNSRLGPRIQLIEHLCQLKKAFTQKCL